MKKRLLSLLLILGFISFASAQNEADKWFFGSGAAIDFSSGSPVIISSPMYTSEGTAAMADATGKLRFFTNGVDVYDSTKTIMPNGAGLMGDVSTTQSALIVPNPASAVQYYIFTAGADGAGDFRYSIVDMTLNGGLGDVMVANKNILLTDSITEKIAAVRDGANGIWIVTHKWGTNQFYSYHLTTGGLAPAVITNVGTIHNTSVIQNTYGQLKFNNCGDRLACAVGYQDIVELFDFNLTTGVVSNPMSLNLNDNVYGVEFSPNGTYLYVTSYFTSAKLSQFNISLATLPLIAASKVPLSATDDLYGMQLGPDGKIYVSRSFSSQFLGVINNPEVSGFGCNYVDNGLDLDPSFMGINGALSLPSFMQTYLKLATGATCLTTEISEDLTEVINPVYPNPTSNEFSINLSNKDALVSVYDCTGKLIVQHQNVNADFSFGKEFAKGIYFVNVVSDKESYTQKVVKH